MEKTENTVDKRDKYLVAADRIREEIDSLEDEFAKQNIIASEEKKKADGIISKIDGAGREIRGLERDMLTKKEIKKGFLDTLKFAGFSFIPQVIVGYLISLLLSGVAPSILITIIEMILIDVAFIGILELPRVIRCRSIDISQYEEIVAKLKDSLPALEEEKQLHLDNVVTYSAECDKIDEKITKLENDLEYILNVRNQIIEMVLKNAINSTLVDTSKIDADIEERGILLELK